MCGIVGAFGWADERVLSAMLDCIVHRGPDGEGTALGSDVMLGARRLSIVDIDGGDQPMTNEDGSVVVVFNGEIYNHERLREDLQASGHRFESDCDTEVLVHMWEEYGREMPEHLSGMFAFAVWDREENRVFLARDRLGIKPLFYSVAEDRVLWASEVKPLLKAGVDRTVDQRAVREFFSYKYTPSSQTLLSAVRKVEPGTWLDVSSDGVERGRYWQLEPQTVTGSRSAVTTEIRTLLEESIEKRLMADVPVGAFLSGGLDSSAIVGLLSERVDELDTYSIGFSHGSHDESSEAAFVADHFGTAHHEITVDLTSMETFTEAVEYFGEPLADTTVLPTYLLSDSAREDVKVALSGAGADELFAGYYHLDTLPRRRRRFGRFPRRVYRTLGSLARGLPESRAEQYLAAFASLESDERAYLHAWPGDDRTIDRLLQTETEYRDVERRLATTLDRIAADDTFQRYSEFDVEQYVQNDLLYKLDHTTMANSVEGRVPYLDHELVTYALGIPERYKVDGSYKPMLRRAVSDVLPERTMERSKKHFSVPVSEWFQRRDLPAIERWLNEAKLEQTPYVDPEVVFDCWRAHRDGRANYESTLWRTLNYVAWYDIFPKSTDRAAVLA
ncbi:asparagine synthase (glutamine-hydrolyzing) [Haloarcula marina]|uniref:asparagine synthase (glutamine-hydrolyzing) n=1 Tax=Haloarcula marina TaxID=2961574 RepID=UPI0020B8CE28|nr:asparagine synthase (glutamine-hydrolyzing) [Halomicroarcula marina]